MGKARKFTLTLTDDKSGQAIRGRFTPYTQGGKFMKLWQNTTWQDRVMRLQGNSLKVLHYLEMVAGWENEVPGPSEVSKALGIRQPHISRAYAELSNAEFLYKRDGIYRLSPFFCWKGTDSQLQEAHRYVIGESKHLAMASIGRED